MADYKEIAARITAEVLGKDMADTLLRLEELIPGMEKMRPDLFVEYKGTEEDFRELEQICQECKLAGTMRETRRDDSGELPFDGVFPVYELRLVLITEALQICHRRYMDETYLAEHEGDTITELGIDIETYSSVSLPDCGVYKYAESKDFDILLFGYSVNRGPAQVVDLTAGEQIPERVMEALCDRKVLKTAYNAPFERICLTNWMARQTQDVRKVRAVNDPEAWDCTLVRGLRMGFPAGLAACGEALKLTDQKMKEGADLIKLFSIPNRKGERVLPSAYPEKWETYKAYNKRDVEVEQQIREKVTCMTVTPSERRLWIANEHINDRGVLVDRQLAKNAYNIYQEYCERMMERAREISGLDNPKSPVQIKKWLKEKTGRDIDSLNKSSMDDVRKACENHPEVLEFLKIRSAISKTSIEKYPAMIDCACADGRVRGLFQFYGAARTGRWAGRLVQMQNLPQNHIEDIDMARQTVRTGSLDDVELYYDDVPQVCSELIRTAFVARPGCTYHVCDFSAIEARVIAWLAGEAWVLDVFREGGDIYCATASQMFSVPVKKHGENAHLRQKGKIAVLALGYGGGVSALDAMGGQRMGLSESEEKEIVDMWRSANPHIVKLWDIIEKAAKKAIQTGSEVVINKGVKFSRFKGCLICTLPSGRSLVYPRARVCEEVTKYGAVKEVIGYEGQNQTTKKWEENYTYGGKLTENVVQAIARDLLGAVILRCEERGLDIVFHVHDEIIVEAREGQTLAEIEEIFAMTEEWAKGLPLKGAGYTTPYYLKD